MAISLTKWCPVGHAAIFSNTLIMSLMCLTH